MKMINKMKTKHMRLCMILALGLSTTILNARTWTDTKSGNTAEGDFVGLSGNQVQIKLKSGRVISILLSQLSVADQEHIKSNSSKSSTTGNSTNKSGINGGGSLAQLIAPISIKPLPLTGEGKERKAWLELKNNGKRDIKGIVMYVYYLKSDGTEGNSVPHTQGGFFGLKDNLLNKGKTYKHEISSFFMKDDTASVDGVITEITYEDDSTWPELPDKRPAQSGDDPVNCIVLGVIGEGEKAKPVYALYNYDKKAVKNVSMTIDYLDADGKVVDSTGYGYQSDKSLMDPGKGFVMSGGNGPPDNAVNARVKMKRVTFFDDSWWPSRAGDPDFGELKKLVGHMRSKMTSIERVNYVNNYRLKEKSDSESKPKPSGKFEASLSGNLKDTYYNFNIREYFDEKELETSLEYDKKKGRVVAQNGRFVIKIYASKDDSMKLITKDVIAAFESYIITK